MLRVMGAYAHGARISLLDFDVDIADRGIKCSRVGIRWRRIRIRPAAREEYHVSGPLLKTRSVCSQHKCGPHSPKADQPDSGPDIDRLRQTVAARWNKQDALVRRLANLVDRLLQHGGVIRDSVALYREIIRREVNCFGIFGASRIVRGAQERNSR